MAVAELRKMPTIAMRRFVEPNPQSPKRTPNRDKISTHGDIHNVISVQSPRIALATDPPKAAIGCGPNRRWRSKASNWDSRDLTFGVMLEVATGGIQDEE